MHRHATTALAFLLLLTAGCAPQSVPKTEKKAPDNPPEGRKKASDNPLEGQWKATKLIREERELSMDDDASFPVLTILGKTYQWKQGGMTRTGTIEIDSSKSPKTIDVTIADGILKGEKILAVLEIKGEELHWCQSDAGNDARPPALATKKGTDALLFIFRRVKP